MVFGLGAAGKFPVTARDEFNNSALASSNSTLPKCRLQHFFYI
jgi:hypothetical protein